MNRSRIVEQLDELDPEWRDNYATVEDAAYWAGLHKGGFVELDFDDDGEPIDEYYDDDADYAYDQWDGPQ